MIGFGQGPLKKVGLRESAMFLLNPNGGKNLLLFTDDKLESILTFDWFKTYIICEELSWICGKYPPQNVTGP